MKLRFTSDALAEIDAVLGGIADKSPTGAFNVRLQIEAVLDRLVDHPLCGTRTSSPPLRRILVRPYPYLIFYEPKDDAVVIVGLRHAAGIRFRCPAVRRIPPRQVDAGLTDCHPPGGIAQPSSPHRMTDLIETIRRTLVPIHKEGYPFILIGIVLTVLAGYFSQFFGWIFLILTLWVCYFFRDPERVVPVGDGLVVSPADGRVNLIATVLPPPELDLPQVPTLRVSVFMNVFDCHVNRMPVAGRIGQIHYTPGLFLNAELDKASEDNERNGLVVETTHAGQNKRIGVVQIAGSSPGGSWASFRPAIRSRPATGSA